MLGELGFTALISNYSEYYRSRPIFRRYTKEMIGVTMASTTCSRFNEKYYGISTVASSIVRPHVPPTRSSSTFIRCGRRPKTDYINSAVAPRGLDGEHAVCRECFDHGKNVHVADHLSNLYAHLVEKSYIDCIVGSIVRFSHIFRATRFAGSRGRNQLRADGPHAIPLDQGTPSLRLRSHAAAELLSHVMCARPARNLWLRA